MNEDLNTNTNYKVTNVPIIDLTAYINIFLDQWKWFLVGLCLSIAGAFIYLRYTPHQYEVSTSILIDDKASGELPNELLPFQDLGLVNSGKQLIENEIAIIKSRSLMERVVQKLAINVEYYKEGRVRAVEIYKDELPFKINFFSKDSSFFEKDTIFKIQALSDTNFTLFNESEAESKNYLFGENITTNFGDLTVTPVNIKNLDVNIPYKIKIRALSSVVEELRTKIEIDLLFQKSSVLELKLKSSIKKKAQDILDQLIVQYNDEAVEYKNLIATRTKLFLNERLAIVENELLKVDDDAQGFKTTNKLTDITVEAGIVLENNSELEKKIIELSTQQKFVDYIAAYISENPELLIPANIGLTDKEYNSNISRFNELLLERNRILENSSDMNPIVINLNSQLNQLRFSIMQGVENLKRNIEVSLNASVKQEQRLTSRMNSTPRQEREFKDIQRKQKIVEGLYLFLLQKREENAISLAMTIPNSKLIDKAQGSKTPLYPKRNLVFLIALMSGVLIPFFIFYLNSLFNNKLQTQKELQTLVKAPFLGSIPKVDKVQVVGEDFSVITEAFRKIANHLNFILGYANKDAKTIFVTSTLPNEGKSSVSINLARTLASSNKKVLLIDADLRKPKIAEYLKVPNIEKALSVYLADTTMEVSDIISQHPTAKMDIIQAGSLPPNPSELLMNGRFLEVLKHAKSNYDYIIVDNPPVGLVTDFLLFEEHVDLFLYVVLANHIDKRSLEIPNNLYEDKRMPRMATILNGAKLSKVYGYGYGYGKNE
jgi:capsular exopolysaccharide synthesis family protein